MKNFFLIFLALLFCNNLFSQDTLSFIKANPSSFPQNIMEPLGHDTSEISYYRVYKPFYDSLDNFDPSHINALEFSDIDEFSVDLVDKTLNYDIPIYSVTSLIVIPDTSSPDSNTVLPNSFNNNLISNKYNYHGAATNSSDTGVVSIVKFSNSTSLIFRLENSVIHVTQLNALDAFNVDSVYFILRNYSLSNETGECGINTPLSTPNSINSNCQEQCEFPTINIKMLYDITNEAEDYIMDDIDDDPKLADIAAWVTSQNTSLQDDLLAGGLIQLLISGIVLYDQQDGYGGSGVNALWGQCRARWDRLDCIDRDVVILYPVLTPGGDITTVGTVGSGGINGIGSICGTQTSSFFSSFPEKNDLSVAVAHVEWYNVLAHEFGHLMSLQHCSCGCEDFMTKKLCKNSTTNPKFNFNFVSYFYSCEEDDFGQCVLNRKEGYDPFNTIYRDECVDDNIITETVLPNATITIEEQSMIADDGVVCIGDAVTLIASGGQDYSYHWSNDEMTQSITVNPTSTSTYRVTITDGNNRCISVRRNVKVVNCSNFTCPCTNIESNDIDAENGLNVSSTAFYTNSGGIYDNTGNCISIYGNLIIDQDLEIKGGEIKMQPGASITVSENAKLTLRNVNENGGIYGCDKMWKGITVESGGELNIRGNIFSDAEYAIRALGGAELTAIGNIFEKNHIGVYIHGYNSLDRVAQPLPFVWNTFGCEDMMCEVKQPYEDQDQSTTEHHFAGIKVENSTFTIGAGGITLYRNDFQNLEVGILGQSSFLSISNCLMEYVDVGVSLDNGMSRINNNVIRNGIQGINVSHQIASRIVNNTIENMVTASSPEVIGGYAIINTYPRLQSLVNNNSIVDSDLGIYFSSFLWGIGFEINSNILDFSSGYNGIFINDVRSIRPYRRYIGEVSDNIIERSNDESTDGCISLISSNNLHISNNLLNLSTSNNNLGNELYGIKLEAAKNNFLIGNYIDATSSNYTGLYAKSSTDNIFCCNDILNAEIGFSFLAECNDTKLSSNHILTHGYGIVLNKSTVIGPQIHGGNKWDNTSNNITDAKFEGSDDIIRESQFKINSCLSPLWPSSIYPSQNCTSNITNWFVNTSGSNPDCKVNINCDDQVVPNITTSDLSYILGVYNSDIYKNMLNWDKGTNLYLKLLRNPELLGVNSIVDSFYYTNESLPLGQLADIENQIENLFADDSLLTFYIKSLTDSIYSELLILDQLDSLLYLANSHQDSIDLSVMQLETMNAIAEYYAEVKYHSDSLNEIISYRALNIKNDNENILIGENNNIAYYQKVINRIYLEVLSNYSDSLTSSQVNEVQEIANLCPLEYGRVVYRARSLYNQVEIIKYNDDSLCGPSIGILHSNLQSKDSSLRSSEYELLVWPNPSKEYINLRWVDLDDKENHWERIIIFNTEGIILKSIAIENNTKKLRILLDDLDPGVYFLSMASEGKYSDYEKFVLIR